MRYLQRLLPALLLVFLCKPLLGQAPTNADTVSMVTLAELLSSAEFTIDIETEGIPEIMAELMRASQSKFYEGCGFILDEDMDAARASFDASVDMILESGWVVSQTAHLDTYFKELTRQIRDAESDYLFSLFDEEWEMEGAEDVPGIEAFLDMDINVALDDPAIRIALGSALRQGDFDIPIEVNDHVAKALEFFLTSGRKFFEDALVRSGQYRLRIEQIFREEGLPLDLINLAIVESGFKPNALSRARARGLWQFIQGTGIRYGLRVASDIDERSDSEKSTRAAARYLKDLYEMFNDWNLVLAAYNWGEGNVRRLIERTGTTDFWQLADMPKRMPAETRKHVPLILAAAILSRDPGKYGFPAESDPPLSYVTVAVPRPVELRAVAGVLGTTVDELRMLNPALRGTRTPARYPDFELNVPVGVDPELYAMISTLPLSQAVAVGGMHKIVQGDTLYDLARTYGIPLRDLIGVNGLTEKSILKIGALLEIPSSAKKKN